MIWFLVYLHDTLTSVILFYLDKEVMYKDLQFPSDYQLGLGDKE